MNILCKYVAMAITPMYQPGSFTGEIGLVSRGRLGETLFLSGTGAGGGAGINWNAFL